MRKLRLAVIASVALFVTATAGAAPLVGSFTTAGLGDVRVGPNFIDWGQAGNIFGPTPGDLLFVSGSGSFSALGMTTGTIKDLDLATEPVGTPFVLNNFITATASPAWNFALTLIQPGGGTLAGCNAIVGSVCTPTGSPFTITNLAGGGASVALALSGFVTDGLGPSTAFLGTFTTHFANMNALQILEQLATQGFVQSSYSAEFAVTASPEVPEPATLVLLGSGLFGATFLRRRQANRTI